jgi:hypothetical protein
LSGSDRLLTGTLLLSESACLVANRLAVCALCSARSLHHHTLQRARHPTISLLMRSLNADPINHVRVSRHNAISLKLRARQGAVRQFCPCTSRRCLAARLARQLQALVRTPPLLTRRQTPRVAAAVFGDCGIHSHFCVVHSRWLKKGITLFWKRTPIALVCVPL